MTTAATFAPPQICTRCTFGRMRQPRREAPLPKKYPENLTTEAIIHTFERHPWLEDSRVGALAQSLRDAVIST